jgi:hypothetical protein
MCLDGGYGRKVVLRQRLIHWIGTSANTNILNINWLPRDGLLWPVFCAHEDPLHMVSDLIDVNTHSWDVEKVQMLLAPMDAQFFLIVLLPSQ